ncbi:hypothetical protein HZY97_03920 [Sphingomonas sp. R-74633]|uniref:hypothetical protein n=1 Tax=Sphingomonas sp. R-74633 TaxID=2751188 RepID=UPI0015D2271B|nr:hypothetical protein [Sphingomonas sp. R-74633]NYT39892.1 hypothetical protein [Sphingomonas sp. R-74633]
MDPHYSAIGVSCPEPQQHSVEIVATPAGEAPLWVREAWIGLTLPLWPGYARGTWRSAGVLSSPRTRWGAFWASLFDRKRTTGYLVPSAQAIRLLAAHSPEAADWWRTHTGFADDEYMGFIFDAPACRPID